MISPTAISTALAALKVQVPALWLVIALEEMNWLSLSKFWSLTDSRPTYEPSAGVTNAAAAAMLPSCASSTQSPPAAAAPVRSSDAATSIPVAWES